MPRLSGRKRSSNIAAAPASRASPSEQFLTHSTWNDTSPELLNASAMASALGASSWIRRIRLNKDTDCTAARLLLPKVILRSTNDECGYVRHPTVGVARIAAFAA